MPDQWLGCFTGGLLRERLRTNVSGLIRYGSVEPVLGEQSEIQEVNVVTLIEVTPAAVTAIGKQPGL